MVILILLYSLNSFDIIVSEYMSYTTYKQNDIVYINEIGYGTLVDCGKFKNLSVKDFSTSNKKQSIYFDPQMFNSDDSNKSKKSEKELPKLENLLSQSKSTKEQKLNANTNEESKVENKPINIVTVKIEGTSALVYTPDQNIRKHIMIPVKIMFVDGLGVINIRIEINKTIQSLKKQIFQELGLKIAYYYNIKLFVTSPWLCQLGVPSKTVAQCKISESSKLVVTAEHAFCFQDIPNFLQQAFITANNSMTLINQQKKPKVIQPQLSNSKINEALPFGFVQPEVKEVKVQQIPFEKILEKPPIVQKIVDIPQNFNGEQIIEKVVDRPLIAIPQIAEKNVDRPPQIVEKIVDVPKPDVVEIEKVEEKKVPLIIQLNGQNAGTQQNKNANQNAEKQKINIVNPIVENLNENKDKEKGDDKQKIEDHQGKQKAIDKINADKNQKQQQIAQKQIDAQNLVEEEGQKDKQIQQNIGLNKNAQVQVQKQQQKKPEEKIENKEKKQQENKQEKKSSQKEEKKEQTPQQKKQKQKKEQIKQEKIQKILPKFFYFFGNQSFQTGRRYWEVKLDKLPKIEKDLQIGVKSSDNKIYIFYPINASKNIFMAPEQGSQQYQQLTVDPQFTDKKQYGITFNEGDTLGVLLHFGKNKKWIISYYRNNIGLGTCFKEIQGKIQPIFGLGSFGQITLDTRAQVPIDSYRKR